MPESEPALPVSGGEVTAAARALGLVRKVLKRPDPQRIVEHRTIVKRELRRHLDLPNWFDRSGEQHAPEVLVFRLGQNTYPDVSYRVFRPDDWMKYEVKGLHDRGLEVFTGIHEVAIRNEKARLIEHGKKPPRGARRTVAAVGRIPYEWINHMDWDLDNAEMLPVLHVAYGRKGPCREWVPCELSTHHYSELSGVRFKVRRKGWLHHVRSNRRLRKMDREHRKQIDRMRYGDEAAEGEAHGLSRADVDEPVATAPNPAGAIEENTRAVRAQPEPAGVPELDAGQRDGLPWTLSSGGDTLGGPLFNVGSAEAVVEHIDLGALHEVGRRASSSELVLAVGQRRHVDVPWSLGDRVNDPLKVAVTFANSASSYRAKASFTLRRKGSSPSGDPQWRQTEVSLEPL